MHYFDIPALSSSQINDYIKTGIRGWGIRSPLNANRVIDHERKEAHIFGRYMHKLILEPDLVDTEYVVDSIDLRKNEDKERKAEYDSKGLTYIKKEKHALALTLLDALKTHPRANVLDKLLFNAHNRESKVLWEIDVNGIKVPMKSMIDTVVDLKDGDYIIVDYKTGANLCLDTCGNYHKFGNLKDRIFSLGYHRQPVIYGKAMQTLRGRPPKKYIIIFQDSEYPSNIFLIDLSDKVIDMAESEIQLALDDLAPLIQRGQFTEQDHTGKNLFMTI